MKHLQSAFISGHVRLSIRGESPEQFVQMCTRKGIIFWNMTSTKHNVCEVNVKLKDIHKLRRLKRGQPYKISFLDRKSTRLNSSHVAISYAVFCLKKKKN